MTNVWLRRDFFFFFFRAFITAKVMRFVEEISTLSSRVSVNSNRPSTFNFFSPFFQTAQLFVEANNHKEACRLPSANAAVKREQKSKYC